MNNTVAIIIAAGEATRWKNYLGVPKHYAKVDDEPIIERTVRLLGERGVENIYTVSKSYNIRGAANFVPTLNYEENADADKFLSSKDLWNMSGRTIVLYGDVYFTDKAMDSIVGFPDHQWKLFCRPGPSLYTGTPHGECFAQSFYADHIEAHEKALRKIAKLKLEGKIDRCGGWEHSRMMAGLEDINRHIKDLDIYYVIDDFTEDFDYPADYKTFMRNLKKWRREQRK